MYEISERFLTLSDASSIITNCIHYIYEYTNFSCQVNLDDDKLDISKLVYSSQYYVDANVYSVPIVAPSTQIGTISFSNVTKPLFNKYDKFIKTVVYQMSLALDRECIYNERERIKLAMEGEHIKSTLLRSISHDLRTPLTGIIGASSLILDSYDTLSDETLKNLVQDIHEESTWLLNSIQKILEMTRISEGYLTLNKNFEAVDDLINQAVTHVPWLAKSNRLKVSIPEDSH